MGEDLYKRGIQRVSLPLKGKRVSLQGIRDTGYRIRDTGRSFSKKGYQSKENIFAFFFACEKKKEAHARIPNKRNGNCTKVVANL